MLQSAAKASKRRRKPQIAIASIKVTYISFSGDRVNASATSIQPVHHLPPPPRPATHWSLLTAKLVTGVKWSWIDAAWHAWHWYSSTNTQVISSHFCCKFVQAECLGSPDVLGSSLLVEPCVFSLRICSYRCTSMSPLEWWMSPTPKYHLLFINMKTTWWEVHPCPSMFT